MKYKIISCLLSLVTIATLFTACYNSKHTEVGFRWVREKSYFVDYKINGNKIKFEYAIYFINPEDEPVEIAISAKFKKAELDGWLKYENFFDGLDENGERKYGKVLPNEEKYINFYFEGEYLGGEINTKLSFPDDLMVVMI